MFPYGFSCFLKGYIHMHVYIYIYDTYVFAYTYVYIYIYIYMCDVRLCADDYACVVSAFLLSST